MKIAGQQSLWSAFQIISLVTISRLHRTDGHGSHPAIYPEKSTWNDNFDEVLSLFRNVNVQTFYHDYFESITRGPAELNPYCFIFNHFELKIDGGDVKIYCIKNRNSLNTVVHVNLRNEGLESNRQRPAWNAGIAVFQKFKSVRICVKHCKEGTKPGLSKGNYTSPRIRSAFSVGCHGIFEGCHPACSDAIYSVRHGAVNCSLDTLVGSTCQLRCNSGYVEVGADKTICKSDTKWDNGRRFKCLPEDVGYVVNRLMKNERLTLDGALNELRNKIDAYLGEKSHILPSTRQESTEDTESKTAEQELIDGVRTFIASLREHAEPQNTDTNTDTVKSLDSCAVDASDRKDCGYRGITPDQCDAKGCCYDSSELDTYWCYYKNNEVTPINYTARRTMKKPHAGSSHVRPVNDVNPVETYDAELVTPVYQPLHDEPQFAWGRGFGIIPQEKKPEEKQCGCVEPQVTRCLNTQYVQPLARVFCGESIDIDQSPWHAIVSFGDKMCGGTLISKNYVLTAAHCMVRKVGSTDQDESNKIYLGVSDRRHIHDKSIQVRELAKVIRHPSFSLIGMANIRNDVALIKLAKSADYTPSVRPLCLPTKKTQLGKTCYITGFGATRPLSEKPSETLQIVPLVIKTPEQCSSIFQSFYKRENICAGPGKLARADACRGDSGGPLACQSRNGDGCSWYLAGITSFGKEPCGGGSPGAYADVFHYLDWIRDNSSD